MIVDTVIFLLNSENRESIDRLDTAKRYDITEDAKSPRTGSECVAQVGVEADHGTVSVFANYDADEIYLNALASC